MERFVQMASFEKAHLAAIIAGGMLRNNEKLLWEDVKKSQDRFFSLFLSSL
jgi:hypothetical protein